MSEDFERWWSKQKEWHYPNVQEGREDKSSIKELAWKAWKAGIKSTEPEGLGCETW